MHIPSIKFKLWNMQLFGTVMHNCQGLFKFECGMLLELTMIDIQVLLISIVKCWHNLLVIGN